MTAKVALFSLGASAFALPVEAIRHILSASRIFPLPFLPSEFCGVFLYQGEIVPLLNLWSRFGMTACPSGNQFTIVMSTESGLVGLPAGQVRRIVDREQGIVEEAAEEDGIRGSGRNFVCSGSRYPLLDIEKMIEITIPNETTPVLSSKGTKEA